MELALSLIPGGWLTAAGGGLLALVFAVLRIFAAGKSSERDRASNARLKSLADAQKVDQTIAGRAPETNRKELGRWSKD